MLKIVVRGIACLLALFNLGFWVLFSSARPPLATNPAALAGDGSLINYCELPVLDSSGLSAADIPKGNTPGCGYLHFPLPILIQCKEPIAEGAGGIRGLWFAVEGGKVGHVERVEQCGSRVAITTAGIIHDGGPIVVKRYLDGDQLVWEYANGSVTRMDRICILPEANKTRKKRGFRYKFF
ncbi:MAG: hypothetical protein ACI89D_001713 [Bermanella sp.]|jgi:hypothetical protein